MTTKSSQRPMLNPMSVQDLLRIRDRAVASASSGILIAQANYPDHVIIDVNPAFERITGYTREEALGQNCRFLQGPKTDPATRAEIKTALTEAREVGVTILNYRKDGTPFWNKLLISPVIDDDGLLTHFVGIQTDVTERRVSEERAAFLAEASDRLTAPLEYEATLQNVAELAVPFVADWCTIDLLQDDGGLRRIALTHEDAYRRDQALELMAHYPADPDAAHGPARVTRTGELEFVTDLPPDLLTSVARDDEHLRLLHELAIVSYICVPLQARGRVLGALTFVTCADSGRRFGPSDLALVEDLARRAAMAIDNAQLFNETQAAVRARDQFLSIAAHELRTPVASIKGYAQMLLRGHRKGRLSPERLTRSLVTIDSATDRLALLTSDLLDVSRIRLGQLPLRPHTLDLSHVVREIALRYSETFGDQHPIELDITENPTVVIADVDRLDQVLANLIDNAAKYSPDDQPIHLRVVAEGNGIRVDVRDHGIGLPPEATEGIFEPFGRAANAVDHNLPGLGLGLYICRGIIERHEGWIRALSDGDGQGATVAFWIPAAGHGLEPAESDRR